MLKSISFSAAALFCTAATAFNIYAIPLVRHVPGYQMVQYSVLFVAICYAIAALFFVSKLARR